MPIKFRCAHCRQFLGIARAKAGAVVDCPTCGRAVRVPNLDGTVVPLPQPGLELEDSELAQALDELAQFNRPPDEDDDLSDAVETIGGPELPQPLPSAAVELPPPLPRKPIEMRIADPRPAAARHEAMTKHASQTLSAPDIDAELAGLAAEAPPSAAVPSPDDDKIPAWRDALRRHRQWLIAAGLVGLGFLAGGPAGWLLRGPQPVDDTPAPTEANATSHSRNQASVPPVSSLAIHGRISARTTDGRSQPDAQARIVAVPVGTTTSSPIAATGLHAPMDSEEFQRAAARLKDMGGGVAVADERGEYQLPLPTRGAYWLMVISHYQSQANETPASPPLPAPLRVLFDRPEQVIGARRSEVHRITVSGDEPMIWDQVFELPL